MANVTSGVFPCYKNQFEIGASEESTNTIADMESYSVSFDGGMEEWKPYEAEGWTDRLKTANSITISVSGKRNIGDTGNDFVAGKAFLNGTDCNAVLKWTFPDGTVIKLNVIINVTALGAGDSTAVGTLEFDLASRGKPTITPAAEA